MESSRAPEPTLSFRDLPGAVAYYRDILGFLTEETEGDHADAVVHVRDATIRLRRTSPDGPADHTAAQSPEYAHISVDCPYALYRYLDDRSGHPTGLLKPGLDGTFQFMDCEQNVVSVSAKPDLRSQLRRLLYPPKIDHFRIHWQKSRSRREDEPYRREFKRFYDGLDTQSDIFYMFFTGGLLHWVVKAASYVPDDVNLVLVGSTVPADEQKWIRRHLNRPFFNIDIRVDPYSLLEFILSFSADNFGWLHIDCLVLNKDLFYEISKIASTDCVNGIWWVGSAFDFQIATTYFIYVNTSVMQALRDAGIYATPNYYSYHPFSRQVPGRRYYSDQPTRRQRKQLLELLPASKRPADPAWIPSLACDAMGMQQLMARSLGYNLKQVRALRGRGCDRAVEDISDELLHVGGISYTKFLGDSTGLLDDIRLRYLMADHVVLRGVAKLLPQTYADRDVLIVAELARHGISAAAATEEVRRYLMDRGLSSEAAEAVLTPPSPL
jgi:hypothetical protein